MLRIAVVSVGALVALPLLRMGWSFVRDWTSPDRQRQRDNAATVKDALKRAHSAGGRIPL